MKNNSVILAKSIFFGSLLISGSMLFSAVAAFEVDWFGPAMVFLVATVLGWDHFMNDSRGVAETGENYEEDDVDYVERSLVGRSTAVLKRSFVGEGVVYSDARPSRSIDLEK
jgi:hypothetical protein